MDKNTYCPICHKEFFKASNLRRHTKKFHPEDFVPLPQKKFAFTCETCGKNFSYIRNYRSHQKLHDPNPPPSKIMKKCPLCSFVSDKKKIYDHFEMIHKIKLISEQINFPSFCHFMRWKMVLENEAKTNFIRGYSQQTKYYEEVILFVCHRSGHHFPKSKTIGRSKNDVTTKKIGGFCPASIKMMKKHDGSIKVCFLQTHVGHDSEETTQNGEWTNKFKIIRLRHRTSMNLARHSIVKCNNFWEFRAQEKDEVYVLTPNKAQCEYDCPFTCKDCNTCMHRFSCTCKDWSIKWNMCTHIHLLCRVLNEVDEDHQQEANSNLDITDLIIYDGGQNGQQSAVILEEVESEPVTVSVEEKNIILQEFSELLLKCTSPNLFQDIVNIIRELKTRVECDQMLSTSDTQNNFSSS